MKKVWLVLLLIGIILLLMKFFGILPIDIDIENSEVDSIPTDTQGQQIEKTDDENGAISACFDDVCFEMEVADDFEERQQGLMNRESLDEDSGMLFVFDTEVARRTFWMKNTLIPLDMIWLDSNRTVVYMHENAEPCIDTPCPQYGPNLTQSRYVIELNAGNIEAFGIEIGDVVTLLGM